MTSTTKNRMKINYIIESFFIRAVFFILFIAITLGIYFNKYDEKTKQEDNVKKTHAILSHLITPSLIISDFLEVKRLLYVASSNNETFITIDNDGMIIMADYGKNIFYKFVKSYKKLEDCKNLSIINKYIDGEKYLITCSALKHTDMFYKNKTVGYLLSFSNYKWLSFSPIIFYCIGILIILFLILIILFRKMLYHQLLKPLITLKDHILSMPIEYALPISYIDNIKNAPREIIEIKESFERLLLSLQEEYGKRTETIKMKALIDLAAGVAHDIRSPLIALDIIIKDIKNLPEEQRIIIRNSVIRINDIANNLLTQYSQKVNIELDNKPEHISDLLVSLISEKRVKYRNDSINLFSHLDENAYGKFSTISISAFNRVLSNLIDNSIEAFAKEIKISLNLSSSKEEKLLTIYIQDNGHGIPPETISKLLKGESHSSKEKGHGLGLPHAINEIKRKWNGHFCIHSSINIGTTIQIGLPQAPIPNWFLSELTICPHESIVIVDDDESIHQVWKKRFKESNNNVHFIDHYNLQDLSAWYKGNAKTPSIFLIDYEFIGSNKNGLNIIEELNITNKSYLVTSHHDDINLRNQCEKINLKIIPKTFAAYIPIILSKAYDIKPVDLIFIDDDIMLTNAWVYHGLTKGMVVASYNSIHAFKIDLNNYAFNTPIFIDSDLKDNIKGQDFAKELYEKGFNNIYLSTGYLPTDFPKMYWIKEIIGKEPLF